jgi:hypothetical protein
MNNLTKKTIVMYLVGILIIFLFSSLLYVFYQLDRNNSTDYKLVDIPEMGLTITKVPNSFVITEQGKVSNEESENAFLTIKDGESYIQIVMEKYMDYEEGVSYGGGGSGRPIRITFDKSEFKEFGTLQNRKVYYSTAERDRRGSAVFVENESGEVYWITDLFVPNPETDSTTIVFEVDFDLSDEEAEKKKLELLDIITSIEQK